MLATSGPVDPEILAGHYRGAGDTARACDYYSRGADQAAAALAFDHAARLYRIALELHQGASAQAGLLWRRLGDALANAGRGAEAAQAYLKAAESATAAETLELKRLASTQLLISGHVDEGLALLRTLARPAGPDHARHAGTGPALAPLAPGVAPAPRPGLPEPRREPDLRAGPDPDRPLLVGRGGAVDDRADPRRRLPDSRPLAGTPGRRAVADRPGPGHGGRASVHGGNRRRSPRRHPPESRRRHRPANRLALRPRDDRDGPRLRLAHARPSGSPPRLRSTRPSSSSATIARASPGNAIPSTTSCSGPWSRWGEIAELKRRWTGLLRESQERGDLYAATMLTTFYMTMIKLAGNEHVESEAELEATVDRRHEAQVQPPALLRVRITHPPLSLSRRHQPGVGPLGRDLARVFPVDAAAHPDDPDRYARAALRVLRWPWPRRPIRRKSICARPGRTRDGSSERDKSGPVAHAHYVQAGIAACEEDPVRAVAELNSAAAQYDAAEMPLRAQILRYRLGEIQTDVATRALREEAEQWIRGQGIVSPARWGGMYAPGFAKISTESIETTY